MDKGCSELNTSYFGSGGTNCTFYKLQWALGSGISKASSHIVLLKLSDIDIQKFLLPVKFWDPA